MAVSAWFGENARELPWRVTDTSDSESRGTRTRNPYHALVAEAMLQQTQVSRVVERYPAFIARFPTVHDLARADESDVLAMWSGMGYYRRARNLHAAARMIVAEFGGNLPRDVDKLRLLPGVGRYTAGAIASIALGSPEPIVDGNVARVLLRIEGKDAASDDKSVQAWLWERAEALVRSATEPGVFNEGLMELGATVCTPPPAMPRCDQCPLRSTCVARREGTQGEIPRARTRASRKNIFCATAIVERADGAVLVEQRGAAGMWAGLWQAPTLERADRPPTGAELARALGLPARSMVAGESFEFLATHRRLRFAPYVACIRTGQSIKRGEFRHRTDLATLGMSSPQRRLVDSVLGQS